MIVTCPHCGSRLTDVRRAGRKVAGVLGAVAGAVASALSTLGAAEIGMAVGAIAGPIGAIAGTACGALLAAMTGGLSGCLIGIRLGDAIDEHLLDACKCLDCGRSFKLEEQPRGFRDRYGHFNDYDDDGDEDWH